jgi:hypothetical protein
LPRLPRRCRGRRESHQRVFPATGLGPDITRLYRRSSAVDPPAVLTRSTVGISREVSPFGRDRACKSYRTGAIDRSDKSSLVSLLSPPRIVVRDSNGSRSYSEFCDKFQCRLPLRCVPAGTTWPIDGWCPEVVLVSPLAKRYHRSS